MFLNHERTPLVFALSDLTLSFAYSVPVCVYICCFEVQNVTTVFELQAHTYSRIYLSFSLFSAMGLVVLIVCAMKTAHAVCEVLNYACCKQSNSASEFGIENKSFRLPFLFFFSQIRKWYERPDIRQVRAWRPFNINN